MSVKHDVLNRYVLPLSRLLCVTLIGHGLFVMLTVRGYAQGTSFTYQGRLQDGGGPANGNYDFQFTLWDALIGGTQQPQPTPVIVTKPSVQVSGGVFTVQLDFASNAFPGADRFLEISVEPAGGGGFTTLSPRQQVNSTPYAIRSVNATNADGLSPSCIGCVTSNQISSVPGGSSNYIQNGTTTQAGSSFNITGNGIAGGTLSGNIVNAGTQFNLGGNSMISTPGGPSSLNLSVGIGAGGAANTGTSNTLVGINAGQSNTTGGDNSFFGTEAGQSNTTGGGNSFFGSHAGVNNTSGYDNTFFGVVAGFINKSGVENSFFGAGAGENNVSQNNSFFGSSAGQMNTTGFDNAFFGRQAGQHNTTGLSNSFFGTFAGLNNTTENDNTFIGLNAGASNGLTDATDQANFNTFVGSQAGVTISSSNANTTGSRNTFVGYNSGPGTPAPLNNAAAIGANAVVAESNALVLGSINGLNGATSGVNVGIATPTPGQTLTVNGSVGIWGTNRASFYTDQGATLRGYLGQGLAGDLALIAKSSGDWLRLGANNANISFWTNGDADVDSNPQMALTPTGLVAFGVCLAGPCSSDERLKTHIEPFAPVLDKLTQLQPVSYDWRADEHPEYHFGTERTQGLIAQDVEKVFPGMVATDERGYKAVNYSQLPLLLLQAVRELKADNDALRLEVESLKKR
jgi:hypothetical protein